jgi:transcriptional regulator with XRE-family HTH domain
MRVQVALATALVTTAPPTSLEPKQPMRLPPDVSQSVAAQSDRVAHSSVESPESTMTCGAPVEFPIQDAADPDSMPPQLSGRVHQARMHAQITKAELARRVGVCLSAAVQWEHPKGTSPTVANLAKIASICEVAFEWLATGRGPLTPAADDPESAPAGASAMNPFEERLLRIVREVPEHQRELLIEFARSLKKIP